MIVCITFGMAFKIVTQPGELLQSYARYWKMKVGGITGKLMTCPYCLAGQMALWIAVYNYFTTGDLMGFVAVPATIIIVYHYDRLG